MAENRETRTQEIESREERGAVDGYRVGVTQPLKRQTGFSILCHVSKLVFRCFLLVLKEERF